MDGRNQNHSSVSPRVTVTFHGFEFCGKAIADLVASVERAPLLLTARHLLNNARAGQKRVTCAVQKCHITLAARTLQNPYFPSLSRSNCLVDGKSVTSFLPMASLASSRSRHVEGIAADDNIEDSRGGGDAILSMNEFVTKTKKRQKRMQVM